jgi:hypothetical protein
MFFSNKKSIKSDTSNLKEEVSSAFLINFFNLIRKKGFSAIFDLKKEEQKLIANWAQTVIEEYASKLKDHSITIKNSNDLPFSKHEIKSAIKTWLIVYLSRESDIMVNLMKERYIQLSMFQEIKQEDMNTIIMEKKKNSFANVFLHPSHHKYIDLMVAERKALVEDINNFIMKWSNASNDI